jgi:hypothetical protein
MLLKELSKTHSNELSGELRGTLPAPEFAVSEERTFDLSDSLRHLVSAAPV